MIVIMSKAFLEQLTDRAAKRRELAKGSYLFFEGDGVEMIFVIERGLVELSRRQLDGKSIVLQRARRGAVLAESSVYATDYHCDAVVIRQSLVFQLPKKAFIKLLRDDWQFSQLWAAYLAREVRTARTRSEILSRKTVAERLDGWMAWQEYERPEKGQWKSVAEQIGVSPEALYRELAKRRATSKT